MAVVIGTSGLTAADLDEIDAAARERSVGVVASGNFSLTAAMCQAAALLAARHLPQWEIIDYASASKPDVPSGTARELAERLGEIRRPELGHPIEELHGPAEARGATVGGTQIHSVRLPSFVVSTEVVFAAPDERLTIRHDAGGTPGAVRCRARCWPCARWSGESGSRAGSTPSSSRAASGPQLGGAPSAPPPSSDRLVS